jgi:DNA-binding MarR family transcriptional regulator
VSRESKEELIGQVIHLARAHQAANDAFDEVAYQKLGINRTDGRCLDIVENQGPMTAGRLAELSGLTTAAVTAVLDRLEKAGYARRVRDESDRRQVIVELTPLMAERGQQIWGPLGKDAFADIGRMSVEELKLVMEFFRRGREVNERHVERVRNLSFE